MALPHIVSSAGSRHLPSVRVNNKKSLLFPAERLTTAAGHVFGRSARYQKKTPSAKPMGKSPLEEGINEATDKFYARKLSLY